MSQEVVKAFFDKVEVDNALNVSYKELVKGMANDKLDQDRATTKVVQFASTHGFEFAANDLSAFTRSMSQGELSDEDLEAVAGGLSVVWILLGTTKTGHDENTQVCFIVGFTG
jgi:predicted ribosomally synthesized peptide with nif11-like leader